MEFIPPQQTVGIPATHMRPLIPASRMEFHTQRLYAVSIFVLLQAWKLADLLLVNFASNPEQHQGFLYKWVLIDTCYFVALHVAKVPWLQFSIWKTSFLIVMVSLINSLLFAGTGVSKCLSLKFTVTDVFF